MVLTLVLVAALIRVFFVFDVAGTPCQRLHAWPESDMHFFVQWARIVAEGDLLTDRELHPLHGWHLMVAEDAVARHPMLAAELGEPGGADLDSVAARLWNRWYGGKRFHQEPLYPYLIALTLRVFGEDVRWVFAWQMLLGISCSVLVHRIARRLFGPLVAVVAAAAFVLSAPALHFEWVLLRTVPIQFAGLLLAWLALRARACSTPRGWLVLGVVLGVALLLKTVFLLFGVGMAGLVIQKSLRDLPALRSSLLPLLVGTSIALAPAVLRNVMVGAPALGLSSVNAVTFVNANAEDYPPAEGFFISRHAADILAETGGASLPAAVRTIATHDGIVSYGRQLAGKLASVLHWYEKPNNVNLYYASTHSWLLRALPMSFGIIAPFAILGLALTLAQRSARRPWELWLVIACHGAALLLGYVIARFRVPLHAALLPFAAFGAVRLIDWVLRRRYLAAGIATLTVLLIGAFVMRPLPAGRRPILPADYVSAYRYDARVRAEAAEAELEFARALGILDEFAQSEPDYIRALGPGRPPTTAEDRALAGLYWVVHGDRAALAVKAGSTAAARDADECKRALGAALGL